MLRALRTITFIATLLLSAVASAAVKPAVFSFSNNHLIHINEIGFEHTLIFDSERSIRWTERFKEFEYMGKMYDVISYNIIDGKIVLKVEYDSFDSSLIRPNEAKSNNIFFINLLKMQASAKTSPNSTSLIDRLKRISCSDQDINAPGRHIEIDRPPP